MYETNPFAPPLELKLMGDLTILIDGHEVSDQASPDGSRKLAVPAKTMLILAFIALSGGEASREKIRGALYPTNDSETQKNNLKQRLTELRKALGEKKDLLQEDNYPKLSLIMDQVQVDVLQFDRDIVSNSPAVMQAAVERYAPLMPGSDSLPWVLTERKKRLDAFHRAVAILRNHLYEQGHWKQSVAISERAYTFDPLNEIVFQRFLEALGNAKDATRVNDEFDKWEKKCRKTLGRAPEKYTVEIRTRINNNTWKQPGPGARSLLTPAQTILPPENIIKPPYLISNLIGREGDISKLLDRLTTKKSRLITISGAGGLGKTSLAAELATQLSDQFQGWISYVELSSVTNPISIGPEILKSMGYEATPGKAWTTDLRSNLPSTPVLIIVDNCEHLRKGAAEALLNLLQALPQVQVLTTSRGGLGITGEYLHHIEPLAVPTEGDLPTSKTDVNDWIESHPSVTLFITRAQERRDFEPRIADATPVSQICRKLEGIPLALEMAASRTTEFSLTELAMRLDGLFDTLKWDNPVVADRQLTMEAMVKVERGPA